MFVLRYFFIMVDTWLTTIHVILLVFIRLLTNLLPGLHLLDVASLEIVTSLFRDDCNSNSTTIGRTLPIAIFLDEQG